MNKQILGILSNEKKVREIRNIVSRYGFKISSSILLSICILVSNASSSYEKEQNYDYDETNSIVTPNIIKKLPLIENNLKEIEPVYVELTYEEKIERILSLYNLTEYELDVCCAITCAEACGEGTNYEEAVNVINTAYNRIISKTWVAYFGNNIYEQLTAPNQFIVYQNGRYKEYLGKTELPGYQAVIDFLSNTCSLKAHNYLAFRSNQTKIDGSIMLVSGGNNYFSPLTDDDKLEDFRIEQSGVTLLLKKQLPF